MSSCCWLWCVSWFLRVPFQSRGFGCGWVLPFCGSCAHVRLGGVAVPVELGGGRWWCGVFGAFCLVCLGFCRVMGLSNGLLLSVGLYCGSQDLNNYFICLSNSIFKIILNEEVYLLL